MLLIRNHALVETSGSGRHTRHRTLGPLPPHCAALPSHTFERPTSVCFRLQCRLFEASFYHDGAIASVTELEA